MRNAIAGFHFPTITPTIVAAGIERISTDQGAIPAQLGEQVENRLIVGTLTFHYEGHRRNDIPFSSLLSTTLTFQWTASNAVYKQ